MSTSVSEHTWPDSVDHELASRIVDVIVKEGMLDRALMRPDVTLDELNFDSLEAVMVINGIEDSFDIEIGSDLRLGEALNLGELVALLAEAVKHASHTAQR
ncbi:acyl carrier protein [Bosea psychrotolerans]|uniref:Acyl carrier protein n=1 Tax=Bosea psychrotolerans TaxID=1871628 RepID=A0A2S4LVQ5_9HYPH|nr:acyl carrier protein [Bosea psychrotolerans]POR46532.1 acyl carrier protein [Bosea psychrotolerans]